MLKRTSILLVIAASVGWAGVSFHRHTRQIPFTAVGWLGGNDRMRFQMRDSLRALYEAGALNDRASVDRLLGKDDRPGSPPDYPYYRYFRLIEWDGNPWHLWIRFDEQGRLESFNLNVD